MDQKDGGPAFPVVGMDQRGGQQFVGIFNGGMSLRDYFAAAVLAGRHISPDRSDYTDDEDAAAAYAAADAMLLAREKKP